MKKVGISISLMLIMLLFFSCAGKVTKSMYDGEWIATGVDWAKSDDNLKQWLAGKTTILKVDTTNSKFEISQNGKVQISGKLDKFISNHYKLSFTLSNGEKTNGYLQIAENNGFYDGLWFGYKFREKYYYDREICFNKN